MRADNLVLHTEPASCICDFLRVIPLIIDCFDFSMNIVPWVDRSQYSTQPGELGHNLCGVQAGVFLPVVWLPLTDVLQLGAALALAGRLPPDPRLVPVQGSAVQQCRAGDPPLLVRPAVPLPPPGLVLLPPVQPWAAQLPQVTHPIAWYTGHTWSRRNRSAWPPSCCCCARPSTWLGHHPSVILQCKREVIPSKVII